MFLQRGEPDHVNEAGVKWWLDKALTEWAIKPDIYGVSLDDHRVWLVELPSGEKSYLLTSKQGPLYESKEMEAMACKIDFIKLDVQHSKKR